MTGRAEEPGGDAVERADALLTHVAGGVRGAAGGVRGAAGGARDVAQRALARAREEAEDVWAEARSERDASSGRRSGG